MKYKGVLDDEREIAGIYSSIMQQSWIVGYDEVDRIVVYGERGEYGFIPWFEIWVNGELMHRISGAEITSVDYKREKEL